MYIENINGPADVKKLNIAQMTVRPEFRHGRGNHRTALCIRVPEG